jgi:hypothetical protein
LVYDVVPTAENRSTIDARFQSFTFSNGQTYDIEVTTPDPPGAVMVFTGMLVTCGSGNSTTATFPHFSFASYTTTGLYLIPANELIPILGESGRVKALGVRFASTSIETPTGGQFNL